MDKQITKANALIAKGEPGRRAKFVKKAAGDNYALDEALSTKAESLLGIKGYYTNLSKEVMDNLAIIAHYRGLWHVEATFRMSKSDLATRPIFHHKENAVKAHLLICFVAMVMGKYMEIKTGRSLRNIADILWSVTDARIVDNVTGAEFTLRSEPDEKTRQFLNKLGLSLKHLSLQY